jgi:hypothetical protein
MPLEGGDFTAMEQETGAYSHETSLASLAARVRWQLTACAGVTSAGGAALRVPHGSKMLQFLIGVLAVFLIVASALAADTYVLGHVRQDGTSIHPEVRSTPDGDPTNNRWSMQGASLLDTVSGGEANKAVAAVRLSCATSIQPRVPPLQCETLLRHSR